MKIVLLLYQRDSVLIQLGISVSVASYTIPCSICICIDLPEGSIMDYGPQSICVANSNTNVANCVVHQCVQIQGTELMAFSLTVNGIVWLLAFVMFSY